MPNKNFIPAKPARHRKTCLKARSGWVRDKEMRRNGPFMYLITRTWHIILGKLSTGYICFLWDGPSRRVLFSWQVWCAAISRNKNFAGNGNQQ